MKHCNKCKLAISKELDRYISVEDINMGEKLSKLYFHKNCWSEIMVGKANLNKITNMAQDFMNKASGFVDDKSGAEVIIK